MNVLIRRGEPAGKLLLRYLVGEERERLRMLVARLLFEGRVVDRAPVEPGRRSRFESLQLEAEFPE